VCSTLDSHALSNAQDGRHAHSSRQVQLVCSIVALENAGEEVRTESTKLRGCRADIRRTGNVMADPDDDGDGDNVYIHVSKFQRSCE
jgi:hypothetical protein